MTGLRALLSPRGVLAAPRLRAGRIGARRLRRVTRRALGRALKLRDPLVLTRNPRGQLLYLCLKPRVLRREREQHLNDGIAPPVINRLSLTALHTTKFDKAALCPPDGLNAYFFAAINEPLEHEDPSDRLLDVERQLTWLRELGLDDVDCYWKWLEIALLIGIKPTEGGQLPS
jgi:hypothetical protein